jgi:putative membrane protein
VPSPDPSDRPAPPGDGRTTGAPADAPPRASRDADREAAWAERPLDPRDYSRRTLLANERTYLAWWRTGLTALAAALAAARVVPELADAEHRWPYTVLGVLCAVAGIVAVAYGHRRRIQVDEAVRRGEFPPADGRIVGAITGLALAAGAITLVLVVLET